MNIKLLLFSFLILISSSFCTILNGFPQPYYQNGDKPSDPNKTPTSPNILENYASFIMGDRILYDARIYFDKDENGKPIYKTIAEHIRDNPKFGEISLAITSEPSLRSLLSLQLFKGEFEIVGVWANKKARAALIRNITPNWLWQTDIDQGGVWCPAQNAIIAGTKNEKICDRFAQYLETQEEAKNK